MTLTLAIDASTYVGSVALIRDASLVVSLETSMRGEQHERLMPLVDRALGSAGADARALSSVICGGGPGSFTSLRIAASIAKGLCVGLNLPMYAVPSLALVAAEAIAAEGYAAGSRVACVMDAMRGDCYLALAVVGDHGQVAELSPHELIPRSALSADAERRGALVADANDYRPHARNVSNASGLIRAVDARRWEPVYGRLAEAQVKWEATHGRALDVATHGD